MPGEPRFDDVAGGRKVRSRWRPALAHLAGSTLVAGAGTLGLVQLWYPPPLAHIAGGLQLLSLMIAVDVVLGPALTFVVASPGKRLAVLSRDLAVILAVQLSALGYGLYTLAAARPVALVFEIRQMRLVSAADIDPSALEKAPPELRQLSWTGPRLIAVAKPTDPDEVLEAIQLGMAGIDLGMRPTYWRAYDSAQRAEAWKAARPASLLVEHRPKVESALRELAASAGVSVDQLRFLPLRSRKADDWVTVIAAPDSRVVGHLPVDGDF